MKQTGADALWTRSFILVLFGTLFLFIPFMLYMPVMPAYLLNELHSSLQVAGVVNAVFLVAAVLFRAQTARLEARFGVRRVLLTSGFMFMATNLLYLLVGTVASIMLIRFFSGVCFAVVNTSIMALGSRLIPLQRKGEGLAYLTTMVLVGGAIGPYIGLNLASSYGYHAVFIFTTLASLLGLLIVSAVPMREEAVPVPSGFLVQSLFEVKAIPVSLIAFVLSVAYGGVLTFVALYSMELNLALVTEYFFVALPCTAIISRLVTGRMYDRLGANFTNYLAIVLIAAGLLLLGGLHTTVSMLTAAGLIGIGYGMVIPGLQAMAIQLSPVQRISAVTATFFSFLDGGIGLGAYLLGGGIHAFGYATVYLMLGGASLSCMLPYYLLFGRKRR